MSDISQHKTAVRTLSRLFRSTSGVSISLLLLGVLGAPFSRAEENFESTFKALLIARDDWQNWSSLPTLREDISQLRRVLEEYGAYRVTVCSRTVRSAEMFSQIDSQSGLIDGIETWFDHLGPRDTALVYVSGECIWDDHQQLCLMLGASSGDKDLRQAIPLVWLRDKLQKANAKAKFVVLDLSDAGYPMPLPPLKLGPPSVIEQELQGVSGISVLTFYQPRELRLNQPEKHQLLVTFWLTRGLSGQADANHDGSITIYELHDFLAAWILNTNKELRATTNLGLICTFDCSVHGVPIVLKLRPVPLVSFLEDVAATIGGQLLCKGVGPMRIAVGMVAPDEDRLISSVKESSKEIPPNGQHGERELSRARYGQLGHYCIEKVASVLAKTESIIIDCSPSLRNIAANGLTESRSHASPGGRVENETTCLLEGILSGKFVEHQGRELTLCFTVTSPEKELLARAWGKAWLNDGELAMLGVSATISVDNSESLSTAEDPSLTWWSPSATKNQDHFLTPRSTDSFLGIRRKDPLLEKTFPFSVGILVQAKGGWVRRPLHFDGIAHRVELHPGETFAIELSTRYSEPVFAAVLVDGLNTLPDRPTFLSRAISAIPNNGREELQPAARVNLSQARCWVLDPPEQTGKWSSFSIPGFARSEGATGQWDAFQVTRSENSEAAQQGYLRDIGVITVAFFTASRNNEDLPGGRGLSGQLGTRRGQTLKGPIESYKGTERPFRLLGVINIFYREDGLE